MSAQKRQTLDSDLLRSRLKLRNNASELSLRQKFPEASDFFQNAGIRPGQIREHAVKLLSAGALAGTLLLTGNPVIPPAAGQNIFVSTSAPAFLQQAMRDELKNILPPVGDWQLSPDQEKKISGLLKAELGIDTLAELDGNRLNFNYGRMGAEQLLPRFPGDSASQHEEHAEKGQTPGLGGWGYFARSKEDLTPKLSATEKYYVAIPIMYLPDWKQKTKYYVDWFRYRHVVVVNPENGRTIVAAVADAGPADWTGKHFGGSPSVMDYLKINYGQQNHPVVLFFLDDPNNEIPLGPLEYNAKENQLRTADKT